MTIRQLRYVVALDQHRQFVKAADSCFVTQPTLTLQVKKLEEEVSAILFDRSSQPIQPTPIGERFIRQAKKILLELDELQDLVTKDRNQMSGEFRLGVIPTLAPNLLPLFISDFLKRHPEVILRIEELQSEYIIEKLIHRELDLALLATPLNEPSIREIPLFYEPFLIYADADHDFLKQKAVSVNQLRQDGLWLLEKGHCFRDQTLNICGVSTGDHERGLIMEGGSIETLKRLVQQVTGYTLIPQMSFQGSLDESHVVPFQDPQPVREISLVVHQQFTRGKFLSEFRQSIVSHIPGPLLQSPIASPIRWRDMEGGR